MDVLNLHINKGSVTYQLVSEIIFIPWSPRKLRGMDVLLHERFTKYHYRLYQSSKGWMATQNLDNYMPLY